MGFGGNRHFWRPRHIMAVRSGAAQPTLVPLRHAVAQVRQPARSGLDVLCHNYADRRSYTPLRRKALDLGVRQIGTDLLDPPLATGARTRHDSQSILNRTV